MQYTLFGDEIKTTVESLSMTEIYILVIISYLGSVYIIIPTAITATKYIEQTDNQIRLFYTVVNGYLVFITLKILFGSVQRPSVSPNITVTNEILNYLISLMVVKETGSFPSGHITASTVILICILYEFEIHKNYKWIFVGILYILIVGLSRVLVGVHYPVDIMGGIIAGIGTVAVSYFMYNRNKNAMFVVIMFILFFIVIPERVIDGIILSTVYILIYVVLKYT